MTLNMKQKIKTESFFLMSKRVDINQTNPNLFTNRCHSNAKRIDSNIQHNGMFFILREREKQILDIQGYFLIPVLDYIRS